jgi:hypothetical protein
MDFKIGAKIRYELAPNSYEPRWQTTPNLVGQFIDKGYTGRYGTGILHRVEPIKLMNTYVLTIIYDQDFHTSYGGGIQLHLTVYEKFKHLAGFYEIETIKPQCKCGGEGKGYHWKFCPAWTRY